MAKDKKELKLSSIAIKFHVGGDLRTKIIEEGCLQILMTANARSGSFYCEHSSTNQAFVTGVIYTPKDDRTGRALSFDDYISQGRPKSLPAE